MIITAPSSTISNFSNTITKLHLDNQLQRFREVYWQDCMTSKNWKMCVRKVSAATPLWQSSFWNITATAAAQIARKHRAVVDFCFLSFSIWFYSMAGFFLQTNTSRNDKGNKTPLQIETIGIDTYHKLVYWVAFLSFAFFCRFKPSMLLLSRLQ